MAEPAVWTDHVTSIAAARNLKRGDVVVRHSQERHVAHVTATTEGGSVVVYQDGTSDVFGPTVSVTRRRPRPSAAALRDG